MTFTSSALKSTQTLQTSCLKKQNASSLPWCRHRASVMTLPGTSVAYVITHHFVMGVATAPWQPRSIAAPACAQRRSKVAGTANCIKSLSANVSRVRPASSTSICRLWCQPHKLTRERTGWSTSFPVVSAGVTPDSTSTHIYNPEY